MEPEPVGSIIKVIIQEEEQILIMIMIIIIVEQITTITIEITTIKQELINTTITEMIITTIIQQTTINNKTIGMSKTFNKIPMIYLLICTLQLMKSIIEMIPVQIVQWKFHNSKKKIMCKLHNKTLV